MQVLKFNLEFGVGGGECSRGQCQVSPGLQLSSHLLTSVSPSPGLSTQHPTSEITIGNFPPSDLTEKTLMYPAGPGGVFLETLIMENGVIYSFHLNFTLCSISVVMSDESSNLGFPSTGDGRLRFPPH